MSVIQQLTTQTLCVYEYVFVLKRKEMFQPEKKSPDVDLHIKEWFYCL